MNKGSHFIGKPEESIVKLDEQAADYRLHDCDLVLQHAF